MACTWREWEGGRRHAAFLEMVEESSQNMHSTGLAML
jgi:hypothetical protein